MDDFAYHAARRRLMAARRRRNLLNPRQPQRLALRYRLRDWGWDGDALEERDPAPARPGDAGRARTR